MTRDVERQALLSRKTSWVVSAVATVGLVLLLFTPLGDRWYEAAGVVLAWVAALIVATLISNRRTEDGHIRRFRMLAKKAAVGALGADGGRVTIALRLGFLGSLFAGAWFGRPASYFLLGAAFSFLLAERRYRARRGILGEP